MHSNLASKIASNTKNTPKSKHKLNNKYQRLNSNPYNKHKTIQNKIKKIRTQKTYKTKTNK
jgi:hypothetical protein